MKRKNKTTKYILAGLFLSSMMGVTTACDPLGIEPTTKWMKNALGKSSIGSFLCEQFLFHIPIGIW